VSYHLSVVIDDELRARLEARARASGQERPFGRSNLSATVRDLLRASVGLPVTTAEDDEDGDEREWRGRPMSPAHAADG